jgi:ADP-ribose pyrophosphatase YjhB (NUDIX family)
MANTQELIVRALIMKDGKILICQTKGRDYYFLPGGHIEFGETMQEALSRELTEETGARVTSSRFVGGIENLFDQEGEPRHEVSFVFEVEIDLDEIASKEEHISFSWTTMEEFINMNIVPPALKDAIIRWTAEKEIFFIEEKMKYAA